MPPTRKRRRRSPPPARSGNRPGHQQLWAFVALGIILLVSWLRAAHLAFPLERDEGEFGYIAQEILRGVPVYESAYTQKLPGTYLLYALFVGILGQNATAIHLGLLLTNAAIMWLIFLILRKTHSGFAGCIGTLVFGVMAMSPWLFGFAAHATFFVTLFALGGLYALLRARERDQITLFLVSGLCFGSAFLMKQSGIFFAPLALLLIAIDQLAFKPRRPVRLAQQAAALTAGAIAPFFVTVAYCLALGKLGTFWFWTFQLAGEFAAQVGPSMAIQNLHDTFREITAGFEVLWVLVLVGVVVTLRDSSLGKNRYVYALFGAASILSTVPGFYFTNHYFVPVVAAIAFFVGAIGGSRLGPRAVRPAVAAGTGILACTGLLIGIVRFKEYYLHTASDVALSHWLYRGNPFPESLEIGEYLRAHTTPRDRIAMLGSETQILFYAQRRSASRFVNAYFLVADHPRNRAMQREEIRDIERVRPKYMVYARLMDSWSLLRTSPRDIFDWFGNYESEHYQLEGVLDLDHGRSAMKWGSDARSSPQVSEGIEILRRRDGPGERP
jgi:Dolichyl-phosphate-mannose-protein mannosyltransferase